LLDFFEENEHSCRAIRLFFARAEREASSLYKEGKLEASSSSPPPALWVGRQSLPPAWLQTMTYTHTRILGLIAEFELFNLGREELISEVLG
jgi:hypothetical protein